MSNVEKVHQYRRQHCSDWYDGYPDESDGRGPYEVRTLYRAAQASTIVALKEQLADSQSHVAKLEQAVSEKHDCWQRALESCDSALRALASQPTAPVAAALSVSNEQGNDADRVMELEHALIRMIHWFGRYPEFIPAERFSQQVGNAIAEAKRAILANSAATPALPARLENIYDFQCEAGPLGNCYEWTELRRCINAMAGYLAAPLPAEQPSNPVPLTDGELDSLWFDCGQNYMANTTRWRHFARQVEARIVGQQTKGGGDEA